MVKAFSILAISLILTTSIYSQNKKTEMKTDTDSLSYCLGMLIGNNLAAQGVKEINHDAYLEGFSAGISQTEGALTLEEANMYVQSYFEGQMARKSEDNLQAGQAFLEENGKKEGVVTLKSGLQYKVLQAGSGRSPKAIDQVKVHYRGTLIDGTVFDSSYDRGQPAQFGVSQVIKGWTEALQLMSEGSHWMLYIPANLAYGESGAGDVIGPNSTLIFEVELLEVLSK